jgi:hypothetical protein
MSVKLHFKLNSLPNEIEKFIIKKLNKNPPKSYSSITNKELKMIKDMANSRFKDSSIPVTDNLIRSIRAGYMKNHMIFNYKNLIKNSKNIIEKYNKGENVLHLSGQFDISPLNILREVFKSKYNMKLSTLITKTNMLNSHDLEQLNLAIDSDEYALIDNSKISKESENFEKEVEEFLKSHNIKYKTQEELVEEQTKIYGHATNTPDFLIKSDFIINNYKINWIDAKNFYGANVPFIKDKIKKQTEKYLKTWGSGAVVFSLGSNEKLKQTNIIFMDFHDLH